MNDPKTFQELVTWATWEIIKSITKGEALQTAVYRILEYARRWSPS